MAIFDKVLDWTGQRIARRIRVGPDPETTPFHTDIELMLRIMRPCDVLLVDGCDKLSAAIRYLTQSSWSHTALYVGDALNSRHAEDEPHRLIEVNIGDGCVSVPLSKYKSYATRICRPVNLTTGDREKVIQFMIDRIGLTYDTRNVFDLARYLIPRPPVPARWRRRMLALGSGEPTRAICSTLIAQAFQSVRYPILPRIEKVEKGKFGASGYTVHEILHIRHHSLYAPRDFDMSPYFEVVKPTLAEGFNYKGLEWAQPDDDKPISDALEMQVDSSQPGGLGT